MNWLIKFAQEDWFNQPLKEEVSRDPPEQESYELMLYRGFDGNGMEQVGSGLVLSPDKCEQGVLWFTHDYINGYNPIEYVQGRGKYLLKYPLQCQKHRERVWYADGTYRDDIPEEVSAACEPTENCRFYQGIELPDGWFFSYKMEKFIVSTVPINITSDMLEEAE